MSTAEHSGPMPAAIEAEGLGKAYRRHASAWSRCLNLFTLGRASRGERSWALQDVSFRLAKGGSLGLVGANGAGKSTLLKILSGTSAPTRGRFRARGRIAALLELGTGFHPAFSGRENVLMNGLLLGCTRAEMRRRLEAILEFSELGAAVEEPVRTYSTGMAMRLGFATALGLEPEVLLLDEVFAVGDLYFQKKCVDRLMDFRRRGGTLVLCSHSLYDLRQMCDEAIWLRGGRVAGQGAATVVTNAYAAWQEERCQAQGAAAALPAADQPRVLRATVHAGEDERELHEVASGQPVCLRIFWQNPGLERVHLGLTFTRQDQTLASGLATHLDGFELEGGHGCLELVLPSLELLAGSFTVVVYLFDAFGIHRHHEYVLARPLVVRNDTREVGLVRLAHHWRVRHDLAPPSSTDHRDAA